MSALAGVYRPLDERVVEAFRDGWQQGAQLARVGDEPSEAYLACARRKPHRPDEAHAHRAGFVAGVQNLERAVVAYLDERAEERPPLEGAITPDDIRLVTWWTVGEIHRRLDAVFRAPIDDRDAVRRDLGVCAEGVLIADAWRGLIAAHQAMPGELPLARYKQVLLAAGASRLVLFPSPRGRFAGERLAESAVESALFGEAHLVAEPPHFRSPKEGR